MTKRNSVVVTGASTGIGWGCVKILTAAGFHVFGSVRKPADAERLTQEFGANVTPLLFDVTDQVAVANAARDVEQALDGETLAGLVNNAGIAVAGPLIYLNVEDFEKQLAVNVTGPLIVTQAFAPLLGADRSRHGAPGRIVMISSVGGRNALPFAGPYAASKFARRRPLGSAAPRADAVRHRRRHRGAGRGRDADLGQDRGRHRAVRQHALCRRVGKDEGLHAGQRAKGLPPEKIGEAVLDRAHRGQAQDALHRDAQRDAAAHDHVLPKRVLDRMIGGRIGLTPPVK